MTGNRAAAALVATGLLGPAAAIGMSHAVSTAGDSWAHGHLDALWVYGFLWLVVCCIGAWTQWRRG